MGSPGNLWRSYIASLLYGVQFDREPAAPENVARVVRMVVDRNVLAPVSAQLSAIDAALASQLDLSTFSWSPHPYPVVRRFLEAVAEQLRPRAGEPFKWGHWWTDPVKRLVTAIVPFTDPRKAEIVERVIATEIDREDKARAKDYLAAIDAALISTNDFGVMSWHPDEVLRGYLSQIAAQLRARSSSKA